MSIPVHIVFTNCLPEIENYTGYGDLQIAFFPLTRLKTFLNLRPLTWLRQIATERFIHCYKTVVTPQILSSSLFPSRNLFKGFTNVSTYRIHTQLLNYSVISCSRGGWGCKSRDASMQNHFQHNYEHDVTNISTSLKDQQQQKRSLFTFSFSSHRQMGNSCSFSTVRCVLTSRKQSCTWWIMLYINLHTFF